MSGTRQHGGNDGYEDQPDAHYSWDSTVPNHSRPTVGDPVALWDKDTLLGASVIEAIEVGEMEKLLHRCPDCGRAGIKARLSKRPFYKCYECKAEFDRPTSRLQAVTTYRSRHDAAWVDLEGVLSGDQVRSLCESPKSQLSLRPLDWGRFVHAVGPSRLGRVERRSPYGDGHRTATARARRGQGAFRQRLLRRYGPVCALTGCQPSEVLEAAHLYSYAAIGVHYDHGGLLVRRDLHRLFDSGRLTIQPDTLEVDLEPELHHFDSYRPLHGERLQIEASDEVRSWLQVHWQEHRTGSEPESGLLE